MGSNFRLGWFEWRVVCLITVVAFPIVLVISAFSNCDVRRRGDKHACADGVADRCVAVGDFYSDRVDGLFDQIFDNQSTARDAYERACKLGNRAGCAGFGRMSYTKSALDALETACDNGSGDKDSCDLLVTRAPERTTQLREKQCEAGDNKRCAELGEELLAGADPARGVALLGKACDRGDWPTCRELGDAYVDGKGVTEDPARAIALYTKACDHDSSDACFELGKSLLATDAPAAVKVFTAECEHDLRGCDALGDIYRVGAGDVARDRARADSFYDTACRSGSEYDCNKRSCLRGKSDACSQVYHVQKSRRFRLGGAFDQR